MYSTNIYIYVYILCIYIHMYIVIVRKCSYEMNNTYVSIYIDTWFTLIFTISGYLPFSSNQCTAVCPTSTAAPTAAASAASGSATGTTTAGTWATSRSAVSSRPRRFCRCCSWKGKTKKTKNAFIWELSCMHLSTCSHDHLRPDQPVPLRGLGVVHPAGLQVWPRGRLRRQQRRGALW